MARLHYSPEKFVLRQVPEYAKQEVRAFKPIGFWYAIDDDWKHFCEGLCGGKQDELADMALRFKHCYAIEVDHSRVLTIEDLAGFTEKYGVPGTRERHDKYADDTHIDWPAVSQEYAGIEVIDYTHDQHFYYRWLYGWDSRAGCIWDISAVASFKEIAEDDEDRPLTAEEIANARKFIGLGPSLFTVGAVLRNKEGK